MRNEEHTPRLGLSGSLVKNIEVVEASDSPAGAAFFVGAITALIFSSV